MSTIKKFKHGSLDEHRGRDGRYKKSPPCDACGKPTNEAARYTDDAVCGGSDGPGFFLCHRKRCAERYADLPVEARREMFTAQRALNETRRR